MPPRRSSRARRCVVAGWRRRRDGRAPERRAPCDRREPSDRREEARPSRRRRAGHSVIDLHGTRAVVTGGTRGIGAATVELFRRAGADAVPVAKSTHGDLADPAVCRSADRKSVV